MSKCMFLLMVLVCAGSAFGQDITQGSLFAYDKTGKELGDCPLKNTSVKTDISGFLARVRVTQEFENSFPFPIEAVYTFPLSQNGAVDDMTMNIGSRTIKGKILKREEARAVYDQAKTAGQTASLLDQERPNIFTQSVANIMPGDKVTIEISYVETLKYEDGAYEFVFPMTVAPRYIPGGVKDAAKITPPVASDRNGSDISIEVNLNAGVPIEEIRSMSHDITQVNFAPATSRITLKDEKTIPNKDFILRYDVTGGKIQDAVLTHRDERGGFFTLILQPPDKFTSEDRTPKEIVFVLDTSGSMSGFPIEKAKEAMKMSLDGLYPDDTFNLITFAGDTAILFDEPVPATEANIEKAKDFIDSREGAGGTEMMKAIKAALEPSDSKDHLRIVCFMTDGEVGNDEEIIAEVQRHPQARVFSFGIGSSVNRYLLDKIAEQGRGEAEYVALTDDGSAAAKKFYERVRTPLLTDLSLDWNGLPVSDVYPSKLTDLFSAKPVIVHGRFAKPASGTIVLHGKVAGQPYERSIAVNLPDSEAANDSLASLWARTRIDELSSDKLRAANPAKTSEYDKEIINLALQYRLMTNFTSFVAVENRVVNQNGRPATVQVPVELPEGMNRKTTLGDDVAIKVEAPASVNGRRVGNFAMLSSGVAYGGGGGGAETVSVTAKSRISKRSSTKSKGRGVGYGAGNGNGSGYGSGSGSAPPPPSSIAVSTPLRIINDPRPRYPEEARQNNIQGSVIVKVTLLSTGKIGDVVPLTKLPHGLTELAVAAAKEIKFEPKTVNGVPVTTATTVIYSFSEVASDPRFTDGIDASAAASSEMVPQISLPDILRQASLKNKLHTWLYSLVYRLAYNVSTPTVNESKFVHDGKAAIQIQLSTKTPAALEKLKAAGLEITTEKGTVVTGRIPIEKLSALVDVVEVKYILPIIN